MSTAPDRCAVTFAKLCQEIRLMIWEMAIGPPSVHRLYGRDELHLVYATPDLIQSTATARACLSVSRVDREIIRRWILPDEIPFDCERTNKRCSRHGVLRYNATKDIICFVDMLPGANTFSSIETADLCHFYHAPIARVAWAHRVENLAMEFGHSACQLPFDFLSHKTSFKVLPRFCAWLGGLKRFYAIYHPPERWMEAFNVSRLEGGANLRLVELPSPEVLLGDVGARIPWCIEGTNSRSYYPGIDSNHVYLEGMAAFEWFVSRRRAGPAMDVTSLNTWRATLLRRCRRMAKKSDLVPCEKERLSNLLVGMMLHVDQDWGK